MNTRSSLRGFVHSPDNWLLALLGVMALSFFAQTWGYRAAAATFPRLVSMIVAVLCILLLAEKIRTARAGAGQTGKSKGGSAVAIAWYWVVLTMVAYFAAMLIIGFNLATLAFMIGFPALVGYRRWAVIGIVAIAMTAAVALGFGSFLHVQLPGGLLGNVVGW